MKYARFSFLIMLMATSHVFSASAQEVDKPQDIWLQRSKILTTDLLKDSFSLTTLDQALVLARAGEAWWKTDPVNARKWMLKAVEGVEQIPSRENPAERTKRISVARTLLRIISTRDEKLGIRLQRLLATDTSAPEAEKTANADGLIEAALALVDTDPGKAEMMGSVSLRIAHPTLIHHLLMRLRIRSPILADRLFAEALVEARKNTDEEFLNSLRYAAFPELYGPGFNAASAPPGSLRGEVIRLLVDDLQQQVALTERSGTPSCGVAVSLLGPLQLQLDSLGPQPAELARQLLRSCQEKLRQKASKAASETQGEEPLVTVDDFLRAAERAADGDNKRAIYFGEAAKLAAHQKNLELALKILDRMTDDQRRFIGIWETWRRDWAASLALEYLKREDLPGMYQVIQGVPKNIRAFTQMYLVQKLPPGFAIEVALQLLENAREGLEHAGTPDAEKLHWHLLLTRLYAKYDSMGNALNALKQAIAALNRSTSDPQKHEPVDDFDQRLIQDSFPASLLDPNGFAIRDVILSVTSVHKRTQAELGLIRVSLRRYEELDAMYPKKTAAKNPSR